MSESGSLVNAPFLVGVTGYMHLSPDDLPDLERRLRTLFRFLRHGTKADLKEIVHDLVPDPAQRTLRRTYRAALGAWTGLPVETPIVVLTNLAPGADTLVARLVLDEFARENFHLRCPLPFPAEIYLGASTFVRSKDGVPDPHNKQRQEDFLNVLEAMQVVPAGLASQADGQSHLPDAIADALRNVPRERLFPVLLRADRQLASADVAARWLADRADQQARNDRYYAAGEYLAVTTHLLLAIWNGQREPSRAGTSAVVEARLTGPQPGLLPNISSVPFPHGGPVWHLFARRPGASPVAGDQCATLQRENDPPPPVRILHPHLLAAGECAQAALIAAGQPADAVLQNDRLRLLGRIAESLRQFNSHEVLHPRNRDREYERALPDDRKESKPFHQELAETSPEFAAGLRRISDVRCRAGDLTGIWQDGAKQTLKILFWLAFVAAVLLDCFTHWVPEKSGKSETEPAGGHRPPAAVQLVCGWLALSLGAVALGYFGFQRARKLEEHGHDARAIAEGLRVQFYWNLAGVGASVSANYLSRHRSELDWIRGVIRSTSMPYDKWKEWFRRLPAALQNRALRVAQKAWVENQLEYFHTASHREYHRMHLWHKLGGVLALAGVVTFLLVIAHESWPGLEAVVAWLCIGWAGLILCAVTGVISLVRALRLQNLAASHGHDEEIFPELCELIRKSRERWSKCPPAGRPRDRLRQAAFWIAEAPRFAVLVLFELVGIFVPYPEDPSNKRTELIKRLWWGLIAFAAHVPLALLLAGLATLLNHAIIRWVPSHPDAMHLGVIAGGILLLGGALSVAWAEKNLHAEQAYQYNTMALLFHVASERLEQELEILEGVPEAEDPRPRDEALERVQTLLFELGKEALDENAEWLLLHRARPLEPVMTA